ncbi:2-hydroxycarboxylate transporter family protein [Paenibacillus kribbensis]|uniref:2-hydroxycarboxylate transporter family protein n=1 Tax=Paenibacillus kribbensis TaxID=172713 RepID=UPI002DBCA19C|nr:2-hydroxycarboxylate transporter family protein [Paenibacillus kribbensis]MEC0236815.1 2-hydroxycarboxylate transporter family protein [Paenibacillus kribbensis]
MNKQIKIAGFPLKYFIPFAAIVLVATYTGLITNDFVGTFAFLLVMGGIFTWVGSIIPIFNTWFGGPILLPLFAGSALVYFHLVPAHLQTSIKGLMGGGLGFPNLFIAAILIGSILCMNRKTLLTVTIRLLPCIIATHIFAFLFLYLGSVITGTSLLDGIFMVGLPNFAGGSSGAIATVPAMYSSIFGQDAGTYSGPFLVYINVANIVAVVFAGLLNKLGEAKPSLTGNGNLLMNNDANLSEKEEKRPASSDDYKKLGMGLLISVVFMVAGSILNGIVPQLNQIAWAAILVIIVKATGFLDNEVCDASNFWNVFMIKNFLPFLITGIGIASLDLSKCGEYFTISNLVIIFMGVLGSLIGSIIVGRLFKLYPIDSGIAVGLNVCNLGGTGAIAVLSTSNRMEMMPFASIANRVGGAIMLIEISLLLPLFL